MGSKIVIRTAKREDCLEIRNLIQELADYQKKSDGPKIDYTVLEKDGFDGEHPLFYSFVAEDNGKLIGFAIYFYLYSTWEGIGLHLEDIYIKSDYRRKGVGTDLFRAVAKQAVKMNCCRLELTALDWNPAQLFYLKLGATNLTKEGTHIFRMERDALEKLSKN